METTIQKSERPPAKPEQTVDHRPLRVPVPSATTPQEFYAEITRRPDVRAILKDLADR